MDFRNFQAPFESCLEKFYIHSDALFQIHIPQNLELILSYLSVLAKCKVILFTVIRVPIKFWVTGHNYLHPWHSKGLTYLYGKIESFSKAIGQTLTSFTLKNLLHWQKGWKYLRMSFYCWIWTSEYLLGQDSHWEKPKHLSWLPKKQKQSRLESSKDLLKVWKSKRIWSSSHINSAGVFK